MPPTVDAPPAPTEVLPLTEVTVTFPCFGTKVTVIASAPAEDAARAAIDAARRIALDVDAQLSRFRPDSELCRLNEDPRRAVPAGYLLRRLAAAARWAGEATDGLVDATCLPALEDAGYRGHFPDTHPHAAFGPAWARAARNPAPLAGGWRLLRVNETEVIRPAGVRLDSGGLAKGIAADLMAHALRDCDAWVVDCAGDLRLGGTADLERRVDVADPAGGEPIHAFSLRAAAVATSGTTRRAWAGDGRTDAAGPADSHHLIDPRTGAPADTGLIQVTALAPTGLLAETRAKAALLSGVEGAAAFLPDGGVLVPARGEPIVLPHGVRGAGR
ncbi:FAD:protein FMN transferase [Paraconexibacter antarcticus]|uniref:FAD:protein FMN transferase n=1 Tax=Paraconexibacter antarcticus TaxID=2949664 RepID=A0ABY5DX64_9ACTN|nr:FAD:protein FMN transferase [Paraconexibacter antarcticus]UTI65477.1 FAD:protein FMN transferase [Paraconexibacter antarcticus]